MPTAVQGLFATAGASSGIGIKPASVPDASAAQSGDFQSALSEARQKPAATDERAPVETAKSDKASRRDVAKSSKKEKAAGSAAKSAKTDHQTQDAAPETVAAADVDDASSETQLPSAESKKAEGKPADSDSTASPAQHLAPTDFQQSMVAAPQKNNTAPKPTSTTAPDEQAAGEDSADFTTRNTTGNSASSAKPISQIASDPQGIVEDPNADPQSTEPAVKANAETNIEPVKQVAARKTAKSKSPPVAQTSDDPSPQQIGIAAATPAQSAATAGGTIPSGDDTVSAAPSASAIKDDTSADSTPAAAPPAHDFANVLNAAATPASHSPEPASKAAPAQQAPIAPEVQFAESNHARIVQQIHGQLLPGGGSMQIRLDPPELGALSLTVRMHEGVMTASFQTSNEEATRLLSHSLSDLKSSLESQGVSVARLHVEQAPKDAQPQLRQDGQSNGEQSQDSPARQEQQRREMLRRMWQKLRGVDDPLDMVA